jgi:hypothetical protein
VAAHFFPAARADDLATFPYMQARAICLCKRLREVTDVMTTKMPGSMEHIHVLLVQAAPRLYGIAFLA